MIVFIVQYKLITIVTQATLKVLPEMIDNAFSGCPKLIEDFVRLLKTRQPGGGVSTLGAVS